MRGLLTLLMFALAAAYRLPCEREATGGEPIGWRRQLLEQTRDEVIVFAQGYCGIFHVAEYSLPLGAKLKDVLPGFGTLQESWRGMGSLLMGKPDVGISSQIFSAIYEEHSHGAQGQTGRIGRHYYRHFESQLLEATSTARPI
jgi:hypothetical protein